MKLKRDIHIVLIIRLLIILLLFILSGILFYLFNTNHFNALNFVGFLKLLFYGIRFDISAIIYVNILFIILNIIPFKFRYNRTYQTINKYIFIIANSIALAFIFIDFIYFRFTLKHTTSDIFNLFGVSGDMYSLIPQFLKDYWCVAVLFILFIIFMIFLYNKTKTELKTIKNNFIYYFYQSILFILFALFSVIGMRGGLQLKPISIITAAQYTSAQNIPLVLNTPFTIIRTLNKKGLKNVVFFKDTTELNKIYSPYHSYNKNTFLVSKQDTQKLNVIIIILESFSKEHFGSLNKNLENGDYKGFTPFLDSLICQGLFCTNAFANSKTSIQAIPAVISSIPTLMDNPYITSIYSGNKINSLAKIFKKQGYTSSFYHGGKNGTMGFDAFAKMAGFGNYYGKDEYNNDEDYDGNWGIFDEKFLQFMAKNLNKTKQPFFATVFTLSSHHPYTIPPKYKDKFRKGKLKIQQSVMYADYSLKKFFETVSKMKWFDNTLFVFTPDHTSEAYHTYYQNRVGMYSVPILYYRHNSNLKGKNNNITQQIDIMPSILDYLNYKNDYIAFGQSIFDTTSDNFSVSYINNTYQLIKDDYALQFDGKKSLSLYNIKKDNLLQNNILDFDIKNRKKMETFLKAVIQSYNNRIINNDLTVNDIHSFPVRIKKQ